MIENKSVYKIYMIFVDVKTGKSTVDNYNYDNHM